MSAIANLISGEEATKQVLNWQRIMNNSRRVPKLPPSIKQLSDETTVWIYNVGPWSYMQDQGSIGTFFIPECPEGAAYVHMNPPLPGVFTETVVIDENNMELRTEPGGGRYVAEQIVGIGPFCHPSNSLVRRGVFVGSAVGPKAKPTPGELIAAKEKLEQYYLELVEEARRAYEMGPQEAEQVIRPHHRLAGRKLGLETEPWMSRSLTATPSKCPACKTIVDADAVLCKNCSFIINAEAYAKLSTDSFAKNRK